jgi:hypothetical protein
VILRDRTISVEDPARRAAARLAVKINRPPEHSLIDLGRPLGDSSSGALRQMGRFLLGHHDLAVHAAILGGSGSGKSKLIEWICRNFLALRFPCLYVDPHSDTARDLAAYVAALKAHPGVRDDETWRNFHLLEVGAVSFGYCPFASMPRPGTAAYRDCLAARVDHVGKNFLRRVPAEAQEVMRRLRHWLGACIEACGVALDSRNTRLGLDKLYVFANPTRDEFPGMIDRVFRRLRPETQADFKQLMAARPAELDKWLESTNNLLRDVLKPPVMEIFARGARGQGIDVPGVMREGGFVAAALGKTSRLGFDSRAVIGGLLIDELLVSQEDAGELPQEDRTACALIVDEVAQYLSEGLEESFATHRKFKTTVIVGGQNLSTFCQGDLDMGERVLSQVGTIVCFQQKLRRDLEEIVPLMALGNVDLETELMQVMDRPDEPLWVDVEEHSEQSGWGHDVGTGRKRGGSRTRQRSKTRGMDRDLRTDRWSEADAAADGDSWGEDERESHKQSGSRTVAHKKVMVPQTYEYRHPTGRPRWDRQIQLDRIAQRLHGAGVGVALAKVRSFQKAFFFEVAQVKEWWSSGRDKFRAVANLRKLLLAHHPYLFEQALDERADADEGAGPCADCAAHGGARADCPACTDVGTSKRAGVAPGEKTPFDL